MAARGVPPWASCSSAASSAAACLFRCATTTAAAAAILSGVRGAATRLGPKFEKTLLDAKRLDATSQTTRETIGHSTEDGGQGWGVTRKGGCQPTRNVTVRLYCVCPGPPGGGGRGRGPGGKFRLKLRLKPGDVCSRSNWASKPAKVTHRGARGRGGARMFENDIPVLHAVVPFCIIPREPARSPAPSAASLPLDPR